MEAAQAEVGAVVSKMISSDSHLIEHPTLWEERMPEEYRERGPRVIRNDEGMDWWYVDGMRTMSFLGIQTGRRFDGDPTKLVTQSTFEDVRPGAYDPKLFVKEAEEDGIVGSVLYPTEGLVLFSVPDSGLCSASMRAYNDYMAAFCAEDPQHLKGIGMINVDDPAEGAAEVARCRDIGLVGALMTVLPPAWQMYDDPVYDVLWAAAQDLQMPLSLHTATNRADPRSGTGGVPADVQQVSPSLFVLQDSMVRRSLADMIFSGVFERFPRLKVGTVEHELAWIPHFLHQLDYTYTDRPPRGNWHRYKDSSTVPSDFFHSNVFCSFQEDAIGIRERDLIGVQTLMWGSDYPHTESTFPRSREITTEILQGVPEAEQEMILYSNAKQLYGFDV
jgi:predicted TIM-barrel fold metal-dependent hydrolase